MGIEPGARFVAHYDMLGMSALVQRDLPKALSAIRQLDDARERILGLTIEILDREHGFSRKHYIRDQVKASPFLTRSLCIRWPTMTRTFVRSSTCATEFSRSRSVAGFPCGTGSPTGLSSCTRSEILFVGPPLVDAYRLGEEGQWLGTVIDEYTAGSAREADLKAGGGDPLILSWRVPLKAGEVAIRNVINWPASP